MYRIDRIVQEPSNRILYYLQDEPVRVFLSEELMHIPDDTQVTPASTPWLGKYVDIITHNFVTLSGYKKAIPF